MVLLHPGQPSGCSRSVRSAPGDPTGDGGLTVREESSSDTSPVGWRRRDARGRAHGAGLDALGGQISASGRVETWRTWALSANCSAFMWLELVSDHSLVGHDGYPCEGVPGAIESAASGGVGEPARATGDEEGAGERRDPLRVGQRTRPLVGPVELVAVGRTITIRPSRTTKPPGDVTKSRVSVVETVTFPRWDVWPTPDPVNVRTPGTEVSANDACAVISDLKGVVVAAVATGGVVSRTAAAAASMASSVRMRRIVAPSQREGSADRRPGLHLPGGLRSIQRGQRDLEESNPACTQVSGVSR